jgi:hypothetical protein
LYKIHEKSEIISSELLKRKRGSSMGTNIENILNTEAQGEHFVQPERAPTLDSRKAMIDDAIDKMLGQGKYKPPAPSTYVGKSPKLENR